ncbi:hypothetical protein ACLKA7_005100 [Drosophila subpalustris]
MAEASTPKRTDDMESDEDSQHEDKTVIEEDVNTKMLRLIMEQMAVLTNKTVDLASQSERVANITQDLAIRVGNLEQPTIMGAHGAYGGAIGLTTQGGAGIVPKGRFAHGDATTDTDGGAIGLATQGGNGDALDKHVATKRVVSHGAQGAYGFVTQDGSGADTQGSNSHEIAISQGAQGAVGPATQGGTSARQDGQHGLDSSAYSLGRDGRLPGRGVSGARGVGIGWLNEISRSVARATMGSSKPQGKAEQRSHQKTVMQTTKDSGTKNDNKMVCYKCKGDHQLGKCDAYLKATVAEKWAMAKELGVCYGCLHRGHSMTSCKFTRACNLNGCKKNHHRTLHNDQRKDDTKPEVEETQEVALNTVTSCTPQILFKVLPVQVVGPNKKVINTFAFIDEGSSASLINEKLADHIGVNVDKTKLTLNWIGKHATDVMSMECQFKIRAQENKKWMRINGNTVPELQLPLQSVDADEPVRREELNVICEERRQGG